MSARTAPMPILAALALFAALAPAARACGICIEDKVAATYDYAVVQRASSKHQLVVFAAVEPAADPRKLRQAAARVAGVDGASVRAAESPPALSFALDPAKANPLSALAAIERQPGAAGVRLSLIRVMR